MNSNESDSMDNKDVIKERYLKVLNSRSVREKALMIGNHILSERRGRGFLTNDEVNSLAITKTEKQSKEYQQYRELFTKLDKHLPIIKQGAYMYLSSLHKIDALLLVIQKNEALEKIVNQVLSYIPDIKEKEKAVAHLETNDHPYSKTHGIVSFIGASHYLDEKDFKVQVTHTEPLEQYLKDAQKSLSDLKALIQSFEDTMVKRRFPLVGFMEEAKNIIRWINSDKSQLMILKAYKPSTSYSQEITEPDYKTTPLNKLLYDNGREGLEAVFNE